MALFHTITVLEAMGHISFPIKYLGKTLQRHYKVTLGTRGIVEFSLYMYALKLLFFSRPWLPLNIKIKTRNSVVKQQPFSIAIVSRGKIFRETCEGS